MPYGIKGETSADEKWMSNCIASVHKSNPEYSEESCIKICKAALLKDRTLAEAEKK